MPAKLVCELLNERIVPSVTYFDYDDGIDVLVGHVNYDDADVDAADSSQELDMTDIGFTFNGVDYEFTDVNSGAEAHFAYGRVVGFSFDVSTPPSGGVPIQADFSGGYLSLFYGASFPQSFSIFAGNVFDSPPTELDTSDTYTGSAFTFTLSDGRMAWGDFSIESAAVVSNGDVDLETFTLNIDGEAFDITDCDATPTVNFSAGDFIGITFSLSTNLPGGLGIDSLVADDDVLTSTIGVAVDNKPMKFELGTVTLDTEGMTTGENYNVHVKLSYTDASLPTTLTFSVAFGNSANDIKVAFERELTNKGIFFKDDPLSNRLMIGGNRTNNKQLAKIEFTLYIAVDGNGNPIPNMWYDGPIFSGMGGMPLPVVKVNDTTISP